MVPSQTRDTLAITIDRVVILYCAQGGCISGLGTLYTIDV